MNKDQAFESLKSRGNTPIFIDKKYDPFRDDKDIVLMVVSSSAGFYSDLSNVSDRLQDDTDVVMAAVNNRTESIMAASERIQTVMRDEFKPGNNSLAAVGKEQLLGALAMLRDLEKKGRTISEGCSVSQVWNALALSDDLNLNLTMNNPHKSAKRLKI